MKKRFVERPWFPFWADKWIFGSMRIECTLEERAIWIDLLAFASKDDGYIRANETTPYLIQQLVGMLLIPEDKLKPAIKKFIKLDKLEEPISGIYRIATWEKYQLSESYNRVQKHRKKKKGGKALHCNENGVTKSYHNKLNHNKLNNNTYTDEFSLFWNYYNYKVAKKDALKAFEALRRKGETFDNIMEAAKGYFNHLRNEKVHSNFEKAMMYPATFLRNEKWKDFLGVVYHLPM